MRPQPAQAVGDSGSEVGGRAHAVAQSLGHHCVAVTPKHYTQPAAVANTATARVRDRLSPSAGGPLLRAEEPSQRLDDTMLERLTELLRERAHRGKLGNQPVGLAGIDPQLLRRAIKLLIHRWNLSRRTSSPEM